MTGRDASTPPAARDDTLGVVLAGGASSRMGRPKATLDVGGEALLRRVVRAAGAVAASVVVVAEPQLELPATCLEGLAASVVRIDDPDEARFGGPLRALGHCLTHPATRAHGLQRVLLLGVDHPAVDEDVTRALMRAWFDADARATMPPDRRLAAVVPRDSDRGPQPLLAMYDAAALRSAVTSCLAAGDTRLRAILDELPWVEWVDVQQLGPAELAWPCNTPDELARLVASLAARRGQGRSA